MMRSHNIPTQLTPLQHELLKLFDRKVPDADLIAIKDLIGKYFLDKLQDKVDEAVDKEGYTQQDFDAWLKDSEQ